MGTPEALQGYNFENCILKAHLYVKKLKCAENDFFCKVTQILRIVAPYNCAKVSPVSLSLEVLEQRTHIGQWPRGP